MRTKGKAAKIVLLSFCRQDRKTSPFHIRGRLFDGSSGTSRKSSRILSLRSAVFVVVLPVTGPSIAFVPRPIGLATDQTTRSDQAVVAVAVEVGRSRTDVLQYYPLNQPRQSHLDGAATRLSWCHRLRTRAVLSSVKRIPETAQFLLPSELCNRPPCYWWCFVSKMRLTRLVDLVVYK